MASRYRWYTPYWGFAGGFSLPGVNALSVGLLSPEASITDPLEEKAYRVTRIVGQYQVRWNGVSIEAQGPNDAVYLTHRIYPVSSDGTNIFTRDLQNIIDADTDWMWNHISALSLNEYSASTTGALGSWGTLGPNSTSTVQSINPFQYGRNGHIDVKVDRRIDEGEELVWKLQLNNYRLNGASIWQEQAFTSGDFTLGLWIRMLVKEAY